VTAREISRWLVARRAYFAGGRGFLALLLMVAFGVGSAASRAGEAKVSFSREVLPILSDNCFYCHGPDPKKRKGDLRLDDETDAKKPHDNGTAIVPGKSGESEMIARLISKDSDEVMPPLKAHKTLTVAQIETLRRWIDEGAKWGVHWAFSELKRPAPPVAAEIGLRVAELEARKDAQAVHLRQAQPELERWPANPIDRFILDRLLREGLAPSPEAAPETLCRRLYLDLTGLPPSPAEVAAFSEAVGSNGQTAVEALVDRLLASPAYGERMAWDWMEVARYADTNGYQGDGERTMWPWRDWVVRVFNENIPYDRFTIWQLAGDQLPNASQEQKLATGFLRNHPINGEGGRIAEENRIDYILDMTETTATTWLALTFNCCRCHDHKFDPLTRRDYYSLTSYFNQTSVTGGGGNPQTPPVLDMSTDADRAKQKELDAKVAKASDDLEALEELFFSREPGQKISESGAAEGLADKLKETLEKRPAQRANASLEELVKQFEKTKPGYVAGIQALKQRMAERDGYNRNIVRVMVMEDMPKRRQTFILDKGLYNKPLDEVTAATPAKLAPFSAEAPRNRLGLAEWLVSPGNPLTPRVAANRFWQMFFGIGLVKTAEDFGVQGEFPKHPELLDWLAADFRESGWDVKRLVRTIVTSATYRQSSRVSRELAERDPENRLLARGARFRMPAWMLRDQALTASGLLAPKIGGPPVKPYQPEGVWEEASFGTKRYQPDSGAALYRRSLYTFWRRIVGPTMFFDSPARSVCTVKPTRTDTPLHALTTLNDATYVEAARTLAERAMKSAPDAPDRLGFAFRQLLARGPKPGEAQVLLNGFDRTRGRYAANPAEAKALLAVGDSKRDEALDPVEHATWTIVCLALLNLDETLTKE